MPDIEGVPYEATGGKLDQATAQALAARHREAASAGSTAGAAALADAKAYTDALARRVDTLDSALTTETQAILAALDRVLTENDSEALALLRALLEQRLPAAVTVPAELELGAPVPAVTRLSARAYQVGFDPAAGMAPAPGPVFYVDPATGVNSESYGESWEKAVKTPFYAQQKGAGDIVIRPGIYDRGESATLIGASGARVRCPGGVAVFVIGDRLTWTQGTGTTWTAPVLNCTSVLDARGVTPGSGEPRRLTQAASAAAVATTPGSWWHEGGTVTVNLQDGARPDTSVFALRPVNSLTYGAAATGNGHDVYLEGIHFWGGTTANLTAKGDGWKFRATRCAWNYATSTNGLSITGVSQVMLRDCAANQNMLDGFNYHDDTTANRTGSVIEVGCKGLGNGTTAGSNNGSSVHENYRALRVDCTYTGSAGANIADVNSARSVNIGVHCAGSWSDGYRQDFFANGTAQMWLDGCTAMSEQGVVAADQAQVKVRDTIITGATTGTVTGY